MEKIRSTCLGRDHFSQYATVFEAALQNPVTSKLQSQLIQSHSFRLDCLYEETDFSASCRSYKTQQRFFIRKMFRRTHPLTKEVSELNVPGYAERGRAFGLWPQPVTFNYSCIHSD